MGERQEQRELRREAEGQTDALQAEKLQGKAPEDVTLEQAFQRLDQIIERLERQDTSLEDSFAAYQQGIELLKQCEAKIDLVEKKVMVLNGEGEVSEL